MPHALIATEPGLNPGNDDHPLSSYFDKLDAANGISADLGLIHAELRGLIEQQRWYEFKFALQELIKTSELSSTLDRTFLLTDKNEDIGPHSKPGSVSLLQQVLVYQAEEPHFPSLLVACCRKSPPLDVIRLMVNSPAIMNFQEHLLFARDYETGRTAFHEAVVHGASFAVIKCILDAAQNVLATQLESFINWKKDIATGLLQHKSSDVEENSVSPSASQDGNLDSMFIFPSLLENKSHLNSPLHDAVKQNRGLEIIELLVRYDEKLQQYNRRITTPALLQTNDENVIPLYLACESAVGLSSADSPSCVPVLKHLILCTYRAHVMLKQSNRVSPFSLSLSKSSSSLLKAAIETSQYMGEHAHGVIQIVVEHVPDQLWQLYKPEGSQEKKMLLYWVNKTLQEPPTNEMRIMSLYKNRYHEFQTQNHEDSDPPVSELEMEDRRNKRK